RHFRNLLGKADGERVEYRHRKSGIGAQIYYGHTDDGIHFHGSGQNDAERDECDDGIDDDTECAENREDDHDHHDEHPFLILGHAYDLGYEGIDGTCLLYHCKHAADDQHQEDQVGSADQSVHDGGEYIKETGRIGIYDAVSVGNDDINPFG